MQQTFVRLSGAALAGCFLVGCQLANPAPAPQSKAAGPMPNAAMPKPAQPSSRPPASLRQHMQQTNGSYQQSQPASPDEGGQPGPQTHTSFYRVDKNTPKIPVVMMSKGDEAMCKVKVGDAMPAISLPKLGGGEAKLSELAGKAATVVVFWKSDRRMAVQQLADMGPEVVEPFGKSGVAVVGIAVKESEAGAKVALDKAEAHFPNLLDADGKAFSEVGSGKLPRTYVLDANGKIVWFDIEYSLATRRELHQTLRTMVGGK